MHVQQLHNNKPCAFTTATSCRTSAASAMLPSCSLSCASLRVSRARSISTYICTFSEEFQAAPEQSHKCTRKLGNRRLTYYAVGFGTASATHKNAAYTGNLLQYRERQAVTNHSVVDKQDTKCTRRVQCTSSCGQLTLPSVTDCSVLISSVLVSLLGVCST